MKNLLLLLALLGIMACNSGNQKAENTQSAEMVEATLTISGLHCDMCTASVQKGLMHLDGVTEAKVTLQDSTAIVQYDAAKLTAEDLKKAVKKRGYEVKSMK